MQERVGVFRNKSEIQIEMVTLSTIREKPDPTVCNCCGIFRTEETKIYGVFELFRDNQDKPHNVKIGQFCGPCFENRDGQGDE